MNLLEKVRELAKKQGLSLAEVNDRAGLGTRSIYHWRTQRPSIDKLSAVANVLHVSVNDLLDFKTEEDSNNSNESSATQKPIDHTQEYDNGLSSQIISISANTDLPEGYEPAEFRPVIYHVKIPVLGRIACGEPILAKQNIEEYRELSFAKKPEGTLFILKCKGKSMEPTIPDGAFVTIRVQPEVETGEMAAVLIGDEATVKRVEYHDTYIALNPDNKNYGPIKINKDNPGRILGKVVHMDVDF